MNEHDDRERERRAASRTPRCQRSRDGEPASVPEADRPPSGRRVLIADDNRDSAESIAMVFRIYGHEVEVVYDGAAAVSAFHTFQPHFVLLDIGMPKLDGYEAASRIRAAAGPRPVMVVALTGWGQESDKERALAAGFDHHFTKPVDPERLNQLI